MTTHISHHELDRFSDFILLECIELIIAFMLDISEAKYNTLLSKVSAARSGYTGPSSISQRSVAVYSTNGRRMINLTPESLNGENSWTNFINNTIPEKTQPPLHAAGGVLLAAKNTAYSTYLRQTASEIFKNASIVCRRIGSSSVDPVGFVCCGIDHTQLPQ